MSDARNQPADGRHLLEVDHLTPKLNLVGDLRGINNFHSVFVERNRFQLIDSAAGNFQLVMRKTLNVLGALEKIGKCGIRKNDAAVIGNYRDWNWN